MMARAGATELFLDIAQLGIFVPKEQRTKKGMVQRSIGSESLGQQLARTLTKEIDRARARRFENRDVVCLIDVQ